MAPTTSSMKTHAGDQGGAGGRRSKRPGAAKDVRRPASSGAHLFDEGRKKTNKFSLALPKRPGLFRPEEEEEVIISLLTLPDRLSGYPKLELPEGERFFFWAPKIFCFRSLAVLSFSLSGDSYNAFVLLQRLIVFPLLAAKNTQTRTEQEQMKCFLQPLSLCCCSLFLALLSRLK